MKTVYSSNLPAFAEAKLSPEEILQVRIRKSGDGYAIDSWPGKAPTIEEVDAYSPPAPPEKIDYAAEVEAAVTAAKSARTVVSAIEITERLAARVADLEARLAKLGL